MNKIYTEPKITFVEYDMTDVISASLAVVEGDNTTKAPTAWWDN